jgi:hypothetical protein
MEKQADSLDSVEEESTLPYDSVPIRYDPTGTTRGLQRDVVYLRVQMRGEGGRCGVSANEYSCAHHVTWSPNKLWRSIYLTCGYNIEAL